jgi:hypothetical protein
MTTDEKFKKLLDIACVNGFDKCSFFHNKDYNHIYEIDKQFIHCDSGYNACSYSLNDLVLQTNFFECLFKGWSLYTQDYGDTLIELRADYIDVNGTLNIGEDSLELSCHKNTAVQFKKFQWVLEVEKGTALEWLFNQFRI